MQASGDHPALQAKRTQSTFDRYGHLMPGNEAETRELLNAYLRAAS